MQILMQCAHMHRIHHAHALLALLPSQKQDRGKQHNGLQLGDEFIEILHVLPDTAQVDEEALTSDHEKKLLLL